MRQALALLGLGLLLAFAGGAHAATFDPIEGTWTFPPNGEVTVSQQGQPGHFVGVVTKATAFSTCTHPAGQTIWDITAQGSGHYTGTHIGFHLSDCAADPNQAATWDESETATGLLLHFCTAAGCSDLARVRPPAPPTTTSPPPSGPVTGTPSGTVILNGKPYTGGPIPYGSKVDVTKGKVTLTVSGGGGITAQFTLLHSSVGGKPIDELRLIGGNFAVCSKALRASAGVAATKPPPKTVRRLFTQGKGSFRTRGSYASAVVRGTNWITADRCDGTFVQTRQGTVAVFDFRLKKTILVKAGHSYLAKKASTTPPSTTGFAAYAQQVDRLLRESAAARKQLQTLAADGSSNDLARLHKARNDLNAVIAVRRQEVATILSWSVPAVARQANTLLASALVAALAADQEYLGWVEARIAGDAATAATALAAAQSADERASSFKRSFLTAYNRLRAAAGLAPLPSDFAF
jgi:hypothetical protein